MAVKLTSAYVVELPLTLSGQRYVYDATLPGFGVRIGTEKKAYIAQARVAGKVSRVTIGATTALTCEAARRLAKEALGKMAGGTDLIQQKRQVAAAAKTEKAKGVTLSQAMEQYVAARPMTVSTLSGFRSAMKVFADWNDRPLVEITPAVFRTRFDALCERQGPNGPAIAAAHSAVRWFRAIWRFVRDETMTDAGEYLLPEAPLQRLKTAKAEKAGPGKAGKSSNWNVSDARDTRIEAHKLADWFKAIRSLPPDTFPDGPAFADYLELLLRAGLRKTEGLNLEWEAVSLQGRTFTVRETKNHKPHALPITPQIEALLLRRKAATGGTGLVFSGTGRGRGRNAGETGRMFKTREMLEAIRVIMAKAAGDNAEAERDMGLNFTYHDLRRTLSRTAERLGITEATIGQILNHSDGGSVTRKHYIGKDPEALREPLTRIGDELDRLAKVSPPSPASNIAASEDHRDLQDVLSLLG